MFSQLYYLTFAKIHWTTEADFHYKSLKSWKIDLLTQQFSLFIFTNFRYQLIKITWLLPIFIDWLLQELFTLETGYGGLSRSLFYFKLKYSHLNNHQKSNSSRFRWYYHTLIRLHSINLDLSDSRNATPSIFITVYKVLEKSPETNRKIVGDKVNILCLIFITPNDSENIVKTAV